MKAPAAARATAVRVDADESSMPPALWREAWLFLARVVAWQVAGLLLWLLVGPAFRGVLSAGGPVLTALAPAGASVRVRAIAQPAAVGLGERVDVVVLVHHLAWRDQAGRESWVVAKGVVTFTQPYVSVVFLVALFGATRQPWRQRVGRGALALGLLTGLMLACAHLDVLETLATHASSGGAAGRAWRELLTIAKSSVTDWPAGVWIAPLLLWLLLAWPRPRRGTRATTVSPNSRAPVSGMARVPGR